jgi:hypothetical protein
MKGIKTVALRHPLKCSAQISERAFEETDAALPPRTPIFCPSADTASPAKEGRKPRTNADALPLPPLPTTTPEPAGTHVLAGLLHLE